MVPISASLAITRNALASDNSRMASALTATVSVWVPALPPIEATMGISTAKATICSIVASNIEITPDARIAVSRLTKSQEKRDRVVSSTAR